MITGLLIIIVVLEVIRFVIYCQDSRAVRRTNARAAEYQKQNAEFVERQNSEWKKIRELEIEELKQLAKESDTMKQIYDEWIEMQKQKGPAPEGKE